MADVNFTPLWRINQGEATWLKTTTLLKAITTFR